MHMFMHACKPTCTYTYDHNCLMMCAAGALHGGAPSPHADIDTAADHAIRGAMLFGKRRLQSAIIAEVKATVDLVTSVDLSNTPFKVKHWWLKAVARVEWALLVANHVDGIRDHETIAWTKAGEVQA